MDVFELLVWLQEHPLPWHLRDDEIRANRACPLSAPVGMTAQRVGQTEYPSWPREWIDVIVDSADNFGDSNRPAVRATLLNACGLPEDA